MHLRLPQDAGVPIAKTDPRSDWDVIPARGGTMLAARAFPEVHHAIPEAR